MKTLRVGDVVTLASGGPEMTIVSQVAKDITPGETWFECAWFHTDSEGDYEHEIRKVTLPAAALGADE